MQEDTTSKKIRSFFKTGAIFFILLLTTFTGALTWYYIKISAYPVTIVIAESNRGQLANQLWQWVNLYAYCLERDYALFNAAFSPKYCQYFAHFKNNASLSAQLNGTVETAEFICHIWQKSQRKVVRSIFCHLPLRNRTLVTAKDYLDLPIPPYNEKMLNHPQPGACKFVVNDKEKSFSDLSYFQSLKKGTYFFERWSYFTVKGLEKYHTAIVEFFKPEDKIAAKIDAFWHKNALHNRFVIGVHIRQGDYRQYINGRHFYEAREYSQKMKVLQERYVHLNPAFIVFSNEERNLNEFREIKECLIHKGNLVEDLYCMARCDKILGPISTYSDWAAFYGNCARFYMEDPLLLQRKNMTKNGMFKLVFEEYQPETLFCENTLE